MSASSPLEQLREAVRIERSEEALRLDRCENFLEQVMLYQRGHGPLPDEQEFLLWREDLKRTVAVRALQSAVVLPAQEPTGDAPFGAQAGAAQEPSRGNGRLDSSWP